MRERTGSSVSQVGGQAFFIKHTSESCLRIIFRIIIWFSGHHNLKQLGESVEFLRIGRLHHQVGRVPDWALEDWNSSTVSANVLLCELRQVTSLLLFLFVRLVT